MGLLIARLGCRRTWMWLQVWRGTGIVELYLVQITGLSQPHMIGLTWHSTMFQIQLYRLSRKKQWIRLRSFSSNLNPRTWIQFSEEPGLFLTTEIWREKIGNNRTEDRLAIRFSEQINKKSNKYKKSNLFSLRAEREDSGWDSVQSLSLSDS